MRRRSTNKGSGGKDRPPRPTRNEASEGLESIAAMLRNREASGHLLDFVHTKNGACMLKAVLVYLDSGEPLPQGIREWLVHAINRVLDADSSVGVAAGLGLLGKKRTTTLGGVRQRERENTRLMLERVAVVIARKTQLRAMIDGGARLDPEAEALAAEPDRRTVGRIAKKFGRSEESAWRTWCKWRKGEPTSTK